MTSLGSNILTQKRYRSLCEWACGYLWWYYPLHLACTQDISLPNILVNFCGNAKELPPTSLTPRENWKPCFVLCDFNISIVFSPDPPHSKRVVAVDRTSWGTHKYHPPDGQNGDTTYNPFAFDVACMGGLLCEVLTVRMKLHLCLFFVD